MQEHVDGACSTWCEHALWWRLGVPVLAEAAVLKGTGKLMVFVAFGIQCTAPNVVGISSVLSGVLAPWAGAGCLMSTVSRRLSG